MSNDRTPRWLAALLVLLALAGLGWAIVRYVQHEDPKEEDPPPVEPATKGKGKGLGGPPGLPPPPEHLRPKKPAKDGPKEPKKEPPKD